MARAKSIKDIKTDLRNFLDTDSLRRKALKKIGISAVEKASKLAPYETGFLSAGGFAFLDGKLIAQSGRMPAYEKGGRVRTQVPRPTTTKNLSIIFTAPKLAGSRASEYKIIAGKKAFDYAPQHEGFVEKAISNAEIRHALDETVYELWVSKK